jgi:hypothetical protein
MSKFGVGVGEDFPVDDGPQGSTSSGAPRTEQEEFEDWKRRRAEWRAQRDHWRAQRDEWKARKRAFKRKVREAARESFGNEWDAYRHERRRRYGWYPFWPLWLIPILCIVFFFSLIGAIFKAPLAILGLVAIGAVLFSHHNRYRHYGYDYDYGMPRGPIVTPPPSNAPPPVTPPTIEGK